MEKFQRGLPPRDQRVLDNLFVMASKRTAEVQYTAEPIPEQIFLLEMLMLMHKEVIVVEEILEEKFHRA